MGIRITNQLLINTTLFNLQGSLRRIARLQDVLANGGKELLRPSDNPEAVATALRLRGTRTELERFTTNIERVRPFVELTESALGDLGTAFITLREAALTGADESIDAQGRLALFQQVSSLLEDIINTANADFAGRFLFGGTETRTEPFIDGGSVVQFAGNLDAIFEEIVDGNVVQINTIGGTVFSGAAGVLTGSGDLAAGIGDGVVGGFDTPLAHLNTGAGVTAGAITITDRLGAAAVVAIGTPGVTDTIGGVIAAINGTGLAVNAQINLAGHGLFIEDTAGVPVTNLIVASGTTTAAELGIETDPLGVAGGVVGTDLDPVATLSNATLATTLADVNNGAGIAFSTFQIQDKDGTIVTVDLTGFTGANTVGDVIAAITGAGTNIVASLDADGSGILLTDTTSTGRNEIRVTEGPSTTAGDLGLVNAVSGTVLEGARLNPAADLTAPGTLSTSLALLDNSNGLNLQGLRVTNGEKTATVDLFGAVTLGDVAAAIEGAGVDLRVDVDVQGKRLILTSTLGNTPITVTDLGQPGDARALGLNAPSIFDTVIQVKNALVNDDPQTLTRLVADIDIQLAKINDARAVTGGRILQFNSVQRRLEDQLADIQILITQTEDADISEVITNLFAAENTFQAALSVAGRVLPRSLLEFLQ